MKPKLGVVFQGITDTEISNLTVEKITVSKAKRGMNVVFKKGTPQNLADKAADIIKDLCHLHEINVSVADEDIAEIERKKNVMIYEVNEHHEAEKINHHDTPKYIGKASVNTMLYGRPIRGNIISISAMPAPTA